MKRSSEGSSVSQSIQQRWDRLIKPPGSLGRMEQWIQRLGTIQNQDPPAVRPAELLLFAGDHGVTREGVSAYPAEVTRQMIRNLQQGNAAASIFCEWAGVAMHCYNVGSHSSWQNDGEKVSGGTANFLRTAAMTEQQLHQALEQGRTACEQARTRGSRLLVLGEVGIGNTTTASALTAALLDLPAGEVVGPGTGLDETGVQRKTRVVGEALQRHRVRDQSPREILRRLGGFELAAHVGVIQQAQKQRLPVVLDGFITAASALVARRINPGCETMLIASHASAEPGHARILEDLDLSPMFDFQLRLGEGTGGVLAVPLLEAALKAYREMATFEEAGVSEP